MSFSKPSNLCLPPVPSVVSGGKPTAGPVHAGEYKSPPRDAVRTSRSAGGSLMTEESPASEAVDMDTSDTTTVQALRQQSENIRNKYATSFAVNDPLKKLLENKELNNNLGVTDEKKAAEDDAHVCEEMAVRMGLIKNQLKNISIDGKAVTIKNRAIELRYNNTRNLTASGVKLSDQRKALFEYDTLFVVYLKRFNHARRRQEERLKNHSIAAAAFIIIPDLKDELEYQEADPYMIEDMRQSTLDSLIPKGKRKLVSAYSAEEQADMKKERMEDRISQTRKRLKRLGKKAGIDVVVPSNTPRSNNLRDEDEADRDWTA